MRDIYVRNLHLDEILDLSVYKTEDLDPMRDLNLNIRYKQSKDI